MKAACALLTLAALALASLPAFGDAPAAVRPAVGAIRWDAWTEWDLYPSRLRPPEWYSRLPFFARPGRDGRTTIRGDRMEVVDREIGYARAAGIDYWAWCHYDPTSDEAIKLHMNDVLNLYRASAKRSWVNYCLIGGSYAATRRWPAAVDEYVAMFSEPNYQKVMGNRPLLYYFMAEAIVPHWGSAARAREALDLLRARCVQAGLGPAYVVGLCFWPDKGAQALEDAGFDAMGSYCNPGAAEGKEHPYADLAALNRWFWNACRETGKPFVPSVNSGWDYRPLIGPEFPDRNPRGDWYLPPTPAELADHVRSAADFVRDNRGICQANTFLIYAWNEFAEGGWICPTKSEGTARLDAIARALRPGG